MRDYVYKKQMQIIYWLALLKNHGEYMEFYPSAYGLCFKSFQRYIFRASIALNVQYKLKQGSSIGEDPDKVYVTRLKNGY